MELIGGYGIPYDPQPALDRIASDRSAALDELWENLYHQGDVGPASYSAVPRLVDAGELFLVAAIEVARHEPHNPEVPFELRENYERALNKSLDLTPSTVENFHGYYVIHASVHGQRRLAKALVLFSVDETLAEYA
ncbi:MAG: hypothetical protein ABJ000_03855 [Saccharospirillum sp.]|uniref:hypothetical protein n=1 Tax=Saccharospirillum sp. TaxID=2033801 RepID=UPI003296F11B